MRNTKISNLVPVPGEEEADPPFKMEPREIAMVVAGLLSIMLFGATCTNKGPQKKIERPSAVFWTVLETSFSEGAASRVLVLQGTAARKVITVKEHHPDWQTVSTVLKGEQIGLYRAEGEYLEPESSGHAWRYLPAPPSPSPTPRR